MKAINTGNLFGARGITTNDLKDPKFAKFSAGQNKKFVVRNENAADLIKSAGGLPGPGEMIAIKTNGQSDVGGFFSAILDVWGQAECLYLATWIISRQNVDRLLNEIDSGRLANLRFLMSIRMQKISSKAVYAKMVLEFKKRERIVFRTANSHAKTFSITNGTDFLTVSGSGNWSENPRIENNLIINSEKLYKHHAEWMDENLDG